MNYDQLAERLELEPGIIDETISNIPGHYRHFRIPKKSGGMRSISAPSQRLLLIQRKILQTLLKDLKEHPAAKAYVRGKNIRENARFHLGQEVLLKLDISDFFHTVRSEHVASVFSKCSTSEAEVEALTKLCVLDDRLPQGAATSGKLSNLVFRSCDVEIMKAVRREGLRYSRYADDISISGSIRDPKPLIGMVSGQVHKLGMRLNHKKTYVARNKSQRQVVTGIVVNHHLSPGREYLRAIRKDIHYALKLGLRCHSQQAGFASPHECFRKLEGKVSFASQVMKDQTKPLLWKGQLEAIWDAYCLTQS